MNLIQLGLIAMWSNELKKSSALDLGILFFVSGINCQWTVFFALSTIKPSSLSVVRVFCCKYDPFSEIRTPYPYIKYILYIKFFLKSVIGDHE